MELVLATRNQDKIREIKEVLADLKVKILTYENFPDFPEVREDGDTLRDNALKKARAVARFTGKVALADDSGLEVKALGGAPGVFSSRFAGEDASYEDNNCKLLSLLKGVPPEKREATFRCVIAISDPQEREKIVEGVCGGKIVEKNEGKEGFGYDPIFKPEGFTRTFAQMSLEEKNQISHRAKALKKAKEALIKWPNVVGNE